MATVNNLYIDQGTSFSASIQIFADNGDIFDLTGFTPSGQIRKTYASNSIAANLITTVTNAANGQISLGLTPGVTGNLKAGRYVYDIEIHSGGSVFRASEGIVVVYPSVTR